MEHEQLTSAESVLRGSGISLLDAARLVRNMLDELSPSAGLSPIQFCNRIIEAGKRVAKFADISPSTAFEEYAASKSGLRPDSLRDIKYMGARLLKAAPQYAKRNFSELSAGDCRFWLEKAFPTPSQFNKGRAMLHGFFEYAIRREWCERNPIKLVERKKIREGEISPLSLSDTRRLISASRRHENCAAAVGLLVLAGIRPAEVGKLKWRDIDLSENTITINSLCSKTGGVRQVEICPSLKSILSVCKKRPEQKIRPCGWRRKWRDIRMESGLDKDWVQDVLRHTYASFHAKKYADLPRLQLNMGHRDQRLLRSRYVNMRGLSKSAANSFFGDSFSTLTKCGNLFKRA